MEQSIVCIRGGLSTHSGIALTQYRHDIFVKRLGWDLPGTAGGLERDQFDRPDTVHVMVRDELNEVRGCARLLPTTRPYLLQELFPDLLGNVPAPCSPDVWELSRFAATRSDDASVIELGARSVLKATIECALRLGARQLIGVTFLSMERLFRRMGIHAHRAAAPHYVAGRPVIACWIDLDAQTLDALGLASHMPAAHERCIAAAHGALHGLRAR